MKSHHIAKENIDAIVQHSYQIKDHGQQIEQLGTALMQNHQAESEACRTIQAIGQQIQKHADVAMKLAEVAQQNRESSTEAFIQAGMEHAEAIKLHVEANRILLRLNQSAFPDLSSTVMPD
jgi:arginyl-tRNA synthetase